MGLLEHAPVGPAFAASHLEIISVLILSVIILDEKLSLIQIIGCALIVGGVIILAMTEKEEVKELVTNDT